MSQTLPFTEEFVPDIEKAWESAARALCRLDGHPENIRMDGKPMWQSYLPEAKAAIEAALPWLTPQPGPSDRS